MDGNFKKIQIIICLLIFVSLSRFSFAQGTEEIGAQNTSSEKSIVADKKAGPTEKFSLVLNSARGLCAQKYPYPTGLDASGQDIKNFQMCQRLEIRGKRIECEINQVGEKSTKGDIFGPETQPSLRDWAQCTGKIAMILEQGYYLSSGEIDRRTQFCNNQFFRHPGEAPQLGLIERFRKGFARPDYQSRNAPAVDKAFFDKSTLQISDQLVGVSRCEYMLPPESSRPTLKVEKTEINTPIVIESPNKFSEQDFKNEAKKKTSSSNVKPSNKELNKKEDQKKNEDQKNKEVLKKKEDLKNTPPIGECRRPLKDCPK